MSSTTETPTPPSTPLWQQFLRWSTRVGLGKRLAFALSLAALAAGFATYAAMTESGPFVQSNPRTVTLLLTLDLALLLTLGVLISRRIVMIWIGRRRGLAGSRLHSRLVLVFSLLAVAPAIIMAVFSTLFFYVGVQSWFSDRVRTAVNESLAVASAYLHEHQQNIRADALAMANDLSQETRLSSDPQRFEQIVTTQAMLRALSEAIVFNGTTGAILARSGYTFTLEFDPIPEEKVNLARRGEVALIISENDDRVRALVSLDRMTDTFLYVGRMVEPRVLSHMASAEGAVREYAALESQRGSLQITFTLLFLVVAMLLLLAAVWAGLNFATRLAKPISALIGAAERVRAGDLTVRVSEPPGEDEFVLLSRAFNRMTTEIEGQRRELLSTNRLLDERRRFTETVLSGVSAGVLGLDADGFINLPNLSAARLLGVEDPDTLVGRSLADLSPEMAELLENAPKRPGRVLQDQIQIRRAGKTTLTLLVRIAAEGRGGEVRGYVVTFDDITELASAQRKAAWADVARRIAHEIKNPLTPIQLSAERLRRKYLKEITSDTEVFTMCTDTIVRQVDDIRRMVDEFSAFARMPQPVMKPCNLNDLVRQAVFLQSSAHAGKIRFDPHLPSGPLTVACDSRQISQALTNLLQNAADAIEGRGPSPDGSPLPPGEVSIAVEGDAEKVTVVVEDNGKGLPTDEQRDRLTEPYVTTRAKGTGLGLAIVKKIMEDHGGVLTLEDRVGAAGARVTLVIPHPVAAVAEPGGRDDRPAETGEETRHAAHGA
ncbi:sensor histidine kinase NtrY-like [Azospirillum agricola]|uniref:sensor histidine kinase NtrY-like n=1 Tax=Azospirillum agricola TaxID=1720247 RepID=UPI000A0EFB4A|nr:PAS domain-containing sensor histidine kinase [Azospirillum agricola]SMH60792.1 two-component system, NtrC family, nitrogen regulation sensor histidine kinase NtrY [Azospirillum lipoferum]